MYDSDSFNALKTHAGRMNSPAFHLKRLIKDPLRLADFSLKIPGFFYDFSRQRLDNTVRQSLIDLAENTGAADTFADMAAGKRINTTENRAALHTAARGFLDPGLKPDDPQILCDIQTVAQNIRTFSEDIHHRRITGARKKPFTDAVVVGIGGSYLGCEFVYNALKATHPSVSQNPAPGNRHPETMHQYLNLHFLSNVDIDNFGEITSRIDPDTCLWIIVSKSFTTTETMANLAQVQAFLKRHSLKPDHHLVTITAKGSPGDDPSNPVLASFHMFDFIGGRYSVTSAVGGVPLSLAFGYDIFERFLTGCARMDRHALNAPVETNIPLTAALISIWNIQVLGYAAQAVIPYSSALSKLAPHFQQIYMESLGKGVDKNGHPLPCPAGSIIFGEPGTNAQHSFFQLAHQGPAFPVEFIGVLTPGYTGDQVAFKGVYNHQELWANLIAQTQALAEGRDHPDVARSFSGNRPSSLLVIPDLSPESIGMLLSFYEARTVFEGFVLNINPFDQFGVELGKMLASGIRTHMAGQNKRTGSNESSPDPVTAFYVDALFNGQID
ncbi:MAG: glucose-6-phosphate isomerase [Desulfotignum sp.]|nr:glucose-6-phosphate isomerase [Desulfotignum sp.]